MARTVLISAGVRTWQESVTGVVLAVVGGVAAGGVVGADELQPRRRRVVARRVQSGVVDIFAGLPSGCARVRVALVMDWDSGPVGDSGLREIIAGWEWMAQSRILAGLRKVRFASCANAHLSDDETVAKMGTRFCGCF